MNMEHDDEHIYEDEMNMDVNMTMTLDIRLLNVGLV
jgi:hypothetical protein